MSRRRIAGHSPVGRDRTTGPLATHRPSEVGCDPQGTDGDPTATAPFDSYDAPAIIETAETRRRVHGQPQAKSGNREKFGNDPEKHRNFSAVTHVAKDNSIPPFLILHVAEHPDTTAQA